MPQAEGNKDPLKKPQKPVYFGSPGEKRQYIKGEPHTMFWERADYILDEFDSNTSSDSYLKSSMRLTDRFLNSRNAGANKNIIVISTLLTCLRENLPILEHFDKLRSYEDELIIVSCAKGKSRDSLEALRKLIEIGVNLDVTIEGLTLLDYTKKFNSKANKILEQAFKDRKSKPKIELFQALKPIVTLTQSDKEHIALLLRRDIGRNFKPLYEDSASLTQYFEKCETILLQLGTSINEILNISSLEILFHLSIVVDHRVIIKLIELGADPRKLGICDRFKGKTAAFYCQSIFDKCDIIKQKNYETSFLLNIAILKCAEERVNRLDGLSPIILKFEENLCKTSYTPEEAKECTYHFEKVLKNFVSNFPPQKKSQENLQKNGEDSSKFGSFLKKIASYISRFFKWINNFFPGNNFNSKAPVVQNTSFEGTQQSPDQIKKRHLGTKPKPTGNNEMGKTYK